MEYKTAPLQIARRKAIPLLVVALGGILCTCSGSVLHAQTGGRILAMKLIPNVVQIRAKWGRKSQSGFGFIVAERDGLLYIATANHVVRGGPGQIDPAPVVRFSGVQGAHPSRLLDLSAEPADLAVIAIEISKIPRVTWTREALSAAPADPDVTKVWSIGLGQKWVVPAVSGLVVRVENVKRNEYSGEVIVAGGLRITGGTSGAPLVSDHGIVGMIVSDSPGEEEVEAIPIERIEAIIRKELPWDLAVISPRQDCDRLAASPYDINRPANIVGVDFDNLDADKAIHACLWPIVTYSEKIPRFAFQLGRALEAAKRFEDAERSYLNATKRGYAAAQSSLGLLYERQNKEADAVDLYRRAADQGDPIGKAHLATILRDGSGGLNKDDDEAVRLYRDAARSEYPAALSGLAWMYEQGRGGLPTSEPDARQLYRRAAAKGDSYAQRALARLGF